MATSPCVQTPRVPDAESLRAVRSGLAQHLPALAAHARRLTRDGAAADDLVQETALRALTFAWSFEPGSNLRAWLHQILRSVFVSGCRRKGRERRALDGLSQDPCAWVKADPAPVMRKLSPPVQTALSELPSSFSEVLRLVDVEELSYKDAASELAVPLGTVMSRLHRARRMLAKTLAEPQIEPTARAA